VPQLDSLRGAGYIADRLKPAAGTGGRRCLWAIVKAMAFIASSSAEQDDATTFWPAPASRMSLAWRDLLDGSRKPWMWNALALQDIRLRYRGSLLGPFWLTISTLVMVVAMGVIYPLLFHMEVRSYVPYLAVGLIVWQLLSSLINEGCDTFLREQSVIQQVPVPFSVHAFRCVCRNFLVLAHNLVIVPIGMLALGLSVSWATLAVIPGFALIAVNGIWISLLLGMVSARFRDVPPIVASFMQVLFFLTPVMWPVEAVSHSHPIVNLNPFFAAIDVVRAPLLGVPTAPTSWPILLLLTILGSALGFLFFARFRTRIAYWI
jgi:ABC-type polysaccharide/polyol phosphate export permease